MKGVVLAGGNGTRLSPLTKVTNKHLLPVYDEPMIYYPIKTLKSFGLKDILVVTGKEYAGDFMNLLGSGKELGVNLSYAIQETAGGIADALKLAENFANGDRICVILGDNIFLNFSEVDMDIITDLFMREDGINGIFLKEVKNPERYGVMKYKKSINFPPFEISDYIVEKPKEFVSNDAVVGLYVYDSTVFDKIKKLKKSNRGEYEITDINNMYLKEEINFSVLRLDDETFWSDAGTFESLRLSSEKVRQLKQHGNTYTDYRFSEEGDVEVEEVTIVIDGPEIN